MFAEHCLLNNEMMLDKQSGGRINNQEASCLRVSALEHYGETLTNHKKLLFSISIRNHHIQVFITGYKYAQQALNTRSCDES